MGLPSATELVEEAGLNVLGVTAMREWLWRQVWRNHTVERLNCDIVRRTDVVGIFPNRAATLRLIGAAPADENDEWAASGRHHMSLDVIVKSLPPPSPEATTEVTIIAA